MIGNDVHIIKSFDDMETKVALLRSGGFLETDKENRNAVFDLDNTLLIGDIGDAVFSMLKVMGVSLNLRWKDYIDLLKREGKDVAYPEVVSSMAGLNVKIIEKATEEVLNSEKSVIEVEGITVPIPKPHPLMLRFIELLKENFFNIYVISATNIFSVKLTADYFFKIPKENCFGIEPEIINKDMKDLPDRSILTDKIKKPLTISTGKEEIYWDKIGKTRPLITAGDSETDIYLMNLVDPKGFSLWVGDDLDRYIKIKKQSIIPAQFFYFKR